MLGYTQDNLAPGPAEIRIIVFGLIIGVVFAGFSYYLADQYMGKTEEQRLDHLKQTVLLARNSIEPILSKYRSQEISKAEALYQVRNLVRRMVYQDHAGRNYIFMSAYDGTMLVQPFEPQKEKANMWHLKDSYGVYIIRNLAEVAKSETGYGYVSYHYKRPHRTVPEEKISFVVGIPELDTYIGTGQYMTDLRKGQRIYIIRIIGLTFVLLILLLVLVLSSMKEVRRQNLMLHRENKTLKQAEEDLQSSEAKYRELFEQSPIGLALCRLDGQIVSVNSAYADIIGYGIDEVLTLSYWEITPEKYAPDEKRQLAQIESCGGYGPYEKEYIHKDGHLVPVRLNGMVVLRDGEKFIWSSVEDITALKKVEKEKKDLANKLRQAYKMEAVGTLAGGIAHDFNNILFPILGYTEMLLTDVPEDSQTHKTLGKIYAGAIRARDLVRQILTFSRPENGELMPVRIQPIIKDALKFIRSTISTAIDIQQDIQAECGLIKADPTQIYQIVINLTTNAFHAMEKSGGNLTVTLKEIKLGEDDRIPPDMAPGAYAVLTIADTGKGMDKELAGKIFDPFFTTKEKAKGTGMGLSVVHGLVTAMAGVIHVYSEPEKGTEFHIYLPVVESASEDQRGQTKEPIPNGTEKILLVDDEKEIISMEKRMLTRLGYQVRSYTNSVEALEVFRSNPGKFDLVITDMAMPGLPGDKFSSGLTKIRPGIPVLLCTGFSDTMSEENLASFGIKGILMKPIEMKDLALKIREVLDNAINIARE